MSYARKKTVSMDEVSIKIGSLSIEQVESISAPPDTEEQTLAATLRHPGLFTIYRMICHSLNTASTSSADAVWTPQRIEAEMDFTLVQWLQEQIMDFNGLRVKESTPGE